MKDNQNSNEKQKPKKQVLTIGGLIAVLVTAATIVSPGGLIFPDGSSLPPCFGKPGICAFDALSSERGASTYRKLEDLLREPKDGSFREADQETQRLLKLILQKEEVDNPFRRRYPCADLRIIDKLWTRYSNYRFGFSVQKLMFEEEVKINHKNNPKNNYASDLEAFFRRVGWAKRDSKLVISQRLEKVQTLPYSGENILLSIPQTTSEVSQKFEEQGYIKYEEMNFTQDGAEKGQLPYLLGIELVQKKPPCIELPYEGRTFLGCPSLDFIRNNQCF